MNNLWDEKSGKILATLQENLPVSIDVPVNLDAAVELISGNLPDGLILSNNKITGTPQEVVRNTLSRFVLRASSSEGIQDRTFGIEVQGNDNPIWQTQEDLLPIGNNGTFYVLDSSPVDYQLEALDPDTAAGAKLTYFIANDGGELPPGITLTEQGRLIGVVDPILALEKEAADGNFDEGRFDRYPYDFAIENYGGFESFYYEGDNQEEQQEYALENNLGYDSQTYDFSQQSQVPRKLNRYYQFTVSVSDGNTVSERTFRIFVVGDDFLRADNVIMQVGTGIFTADNTYLRTPIWITPSDLGVKRVNNFVTLFLDVLDPNSVTGIITYDLLPENNDGSQSQLPPGMLFDRNTGEIFGRVPYQPAVTSEYKFTVNARRIDFDLETIQLQQFAVEPAPENSLNIKINKMNKFSSRAVGRIFSIKGQSYRVDKINNSDANFDEITLNQPLSTNISQGAEIDLGLISVQSTEIAESQKTFTVTLIGEVNSTITWITEPNLGNIPSNYISTLGLKAQTTVPNSFLLYTVEDGILPPGLQLSFFGDLIGKVDNAAVFENTKYQFTVKARDQFGFSEITRQFTINVLNDDDVVYSNIYYKPLLTIESRNNFQSFLGDTAIFQPDLIYRLEDENFGIQREPEILVYAGIETLDAEKYIAAASKFTVRKKLKIRDVKKAVAKAPGTNDEVYEVVYLDVYDPYEQDGNVARERRIRNGKSITVDSISATPNNPLYDTNLLNYVEVGQRQNPRNRIYFSDFVPINLRLDNIKWILQSNYTILTRNRGLVEFSFERGSATNIVYRPDPENTIKADTTAVLASDTKINFKYISNTSNIRDELRDIGKTERDFLPLWMRTAQEGTLQELGFTLAIPLAYCKPGTADSILSAIRASEFDFRQFNFEVDRFVIDSTKGDSEESFILFANREFTLG